MSFALYGPSMADSDSRLVDIADPSPALAPRRSIYMELVRAIERAGANGLQHLPPEYSRVLGVAALKAVSPAYTKIFREDDINLSQDLFGIKFRNPIGIAAGADKDAHSIKQYYRRGFGFIEVGTVTLRRQRGNLGKKIERVPNEEALINRFGFPSEGAARVSGRMRRHKAHVPVGVNIGANRDSNDRIADYVSLFRIFCSIADYIVINISSPNTKDLRIFERGSGLVDLLKRLNDVRFSNKVDIGRVFLKISPDIGLQDLDNIIDSCLKENIDGLIISNTTTDKKGIPSTSIQGGVSGRPLFTRSTAFLAQAAVRLDGAIPIIGVGGVDSGTAAWAKIVAGASLVQLYTSLTFQGMPLLDDIRWYLSKQTAALGLSSIKEAIGREKNIIAREFVAWSS